MKAVLLLICSLFLLCACGDDNQVNNPDKKNKTMVRYIKYDETNQFCLVSINTDGTDKKLIIKDQVEFVYWDCKSVITVGSLKDEFYLYDLDGNLLRKYKLSFLGTNKLLKILPCSNPNILGIAYYNKTKKCIVYGIYDVALEKFKYTVEAKDGTLGFAISQNGDKICYVSNIENRDKLIMYSFTKNETILLDDIADEFKDLMNFRFLWVDNDDFYYIKDPFTYDSKIIIYKTASAEKRILSFPYIYGFIKNKLKIQILTFHKNYIITITPGSPNFSYYQLILQDEQYEFYYLNDDEVLIPFYSLDGNVKVINLNIYNHLNNKLHTIETLYNTDKIIVVPN